MSRQIKKQDNFNKERISEENITKQGSGEPERWTRGSTWATQTCKAVSKGGHGTSDEDGEQRDRSCGS